MRVTVVRRVKPLPLGNVLIPSLSIIIGVLLASLVLYLLMNIPPSQFFTYIGEGFVSLETLRDFILLTILGTALIISFKGAVWNIGAEGQIAMGMLAAAYVALFTNLSSSPVLGKIMMVVLALILGGAWGLIAGILKAYLSIDEVASTLIMNYVAYYILNYLVRGPWKGKHTYGYIRTDLIPESVYFSTLPIRGITITYEEILLLVITLVFAYILLYKTALGVRIRILGSNPEALKAAGVNVKLLTITLLAISGAISGMVGAAQLAGYLHRISYPIETHTPYLGYTAILVAWLSMLDLRAVPIIAFIIGSLNQAGRLLQIAGVGGIAVTYLFIGTILVTFTILRVFSEYRIKLIRG